MDRLLELSEVSELTNRHFFDRESVALTNNSGTFRQAHSWIPLRRLDDLSLEISRHTVLTSSLLPRLRRQNDRQDAAAWTC